MIGGHFYGEENTCRKASWDVIDVMERAMFAYSESSTSLKGDSVPSQCSHTTMQITYAYGFYVKHQRFMHGKIGIIATHNFGASALSVSLPKTRASRRDSS